MRPTRLAFGLVFGGIALFGVGTNVQAGWVLTIAALLIGIAIIGALLPARALRGLDVARAAPPRARAGDPVEVTLTVRNTTRGLRGPLLVRDEFCGEGTAAVGWLGPGAERSFRDERTGARRGVHTSGRCALHTGAPFGVALARRRLDVPTTITVHPRVFDLSLYAVLGRAAMPQRAPAGDISTVRAYRPGDPLRHVHWRSTARRGELVVKEFEDRARSELLVAADTPHDADTLDAIASVACSFALAGLADGREVTLRANSRTVTGDSEAGVLDWGARLSPGGSPGLDAATAGAMVCVLTPDSPAIGAAAQLASDGADVAVVLVDASHGAGPPSAVSAGAERLPAAGAERLRAAGATVTVVPVEGDLASWFKSPSAAW